MSKKAPKFEEPKSPANEPVVTVPSIPKFKEPKQPANEPVRRNVFGQVLKPVVGGIGSGSAK